jgi:putative Mg2+ transporter-C (MgtC) family protein
MEIIPTDYLDILIKLAVAVLLGLVVGFERVRAQKSAGMRTYALVALASALFVIISQKVSEQYIGVTNFDPLRMASQVVVGVGFLGTGLIIFKDNHITNLTTAAGLWVAAGVGMASGFGLFFEAVIVTVLALIILAFFSPLEHSIRSRAEHKDDIAS